MAPRIVLIHAVTVAMPPIEAASRALWPGAERVNLLDDSLSPDRARDGRLTPAMTERFRTLGQLRQQSAPTASCSPARPSARRSRRSPRSRPCRC